jgi:hypothetical protein
MQRDDEPGRYTLLDTPMWRSVFSVNSVFSLRIPQCLLRAKDPGHLLLVSKRRFDLCRILLQRGTVPSLAYPTILSNLQRKKKAEEKKWIFL